MMLVMCVSSACFASDGSVLDAEAKMVDQFLNASSYKNVSSILSDDMKANFDESKFNEDYREKTNILNPYHVCGSFYFCSKLSTLRLRTGRKQSAGGSSKHSVETG